MQASEVLQRTRPIVALLFNVDEASVTEESAPKTIEAWDSLGHLNLVLELEREFEISLPPEVVEKLDSVGAVVRAVLAAKG
ncbi:MAG: acyl carrier protein [Deltaproteobacteria bacterium]|nr:acyl carrier protein [Deltaproteobacteria bacterium]